MDLMQPGETVARAIKRLGGRNKTAAAAQRRQVWKNKRTQQVGTSSTQHETESDSSDLLTLIGCADKLLSLNGELGIYQDTFEKLRFKVNSTEESGAVSRPVDDGLDMFADDTPTSSISSQKTAATTSFDKGELLCCVSHHTQSHC